jgi:hypothetical protein
MNERVKSNVVNLKGYQIDSLNSKAISQAEIAIDLANRILKLSPNDEKALQIKSQMQKLIGETTGAQL